MGTDCTPLVMDLFLFSYEFEFICVLMSGGCPSTDKKGSRAHEGVDLQRGRPLCKFTSVRRSGLASLAAPYSS